MCRFTYQFAAVGTISRLAGLRPPSAAVEPFGKASRYALQRSNCRDHGFGSISWPRLLAPIGAGIPFSSGGVGEPADFEGHPQRQPGSMSSPKSYLKGD
jgi:hypothetical protein